MTRIEKTCRKIKTNFFFHLHTEIYLEKLCTFILTAHISSVF